MFQVTHSSLSTIKIRTLFAAIVLTGFLFSLAPVARMQKMLMTDDTTKGEKITAVSDVEAPASPFAPAFNWTNNPSATRVIGQTDFVSATQGTGTSNLNAATNAAVDPTSGKVFVTDYFNNRVLRFTSAVAMTNGGAAEAVLGQPDFATTFAATTQSKMRFPLGLTVDAAGRLWVADTLNHRVLRFDSAATKASGANADGVLGQTLFTTSTAVVTQNGMNGPGGVFTDPAGRLWVAERSNHRVIRFDNAAAKANGANADGVLGQPLFIANIPATSQIGMNAPSSIVGDAAGRIWVADTSNNRVLRFDNAAAKANGAIADGLLGQISYTGNGAATAQNGFSNPTGIAVDSSSRLYVVDSNNNRVEIFNNAASLSNGANASNVFGQINFTTGTTNTGGISASSLNASYGAFFDESSQNLFVGDLGNNRVLRFGPVFTPAVWTDNQAATRVMGQTVFNANTSGTGNNKFTNPAHVVVDPASGKVFVSDFTNNRVLRFASADAATNGGPAEAVLGQPDFATVTSGTTQSKMNVPQGLAVDTAGRLWVADFANRRVLRFDGAATKASGVSADGVLGQPLFTTNTSLITQSGMAGPTGVFVDTSGRLWVADRSNQRVLRFENAATLANGSNADGVLGQTLFTTNTTATSQTGMISPSAIVGDGAGRLWVADRNNNRVTRFDSAAAKVNGANADGVLGQTLFTTNAAATTQNGMNSPSGVAIDSSGRLYVSEANNNRILIFNSAATLSNGANASNVLGQTNFTNGSSGLSASAISVPYEIFFDEYSQNLFVGDLLNNRVLRFGPAFSPIVSVSGRVRTAAGRGLTNAYVLITDSHNVTRSTITGRSGSYSFGNVVRGETYSIAVISRRYPFVSQVQSINYDPTNIDFVASP